MKQPISTAASIGGSAALICFAAVLILATLFGGCYAVGRGRVWFASQGGEAEYARAEQNRRIRVLEAQAELDASKLKAEAEAARAEGVARANAIIGASLRDNEAYLRWLWIQNLEAGNNSVIYVPTEAGVPILEAGKRGER